jgi:hypothetical protein
MRRISRRARFVACGLANRFDTFLTAILRPVTVSTPDLYLINEYIKETKWRTGEKNGIECKADKQRYGAEIEIKAIHNTNKKSTGNLNKKKGVNVGARYTTTP